MKDLIDKTKAITRMAGITEQAFYRLSKRYSRINFLLAWIIIAMTATVGGSYFSPYEFSHPLILPAIALAAATLGIMIRISRITVRSIECRTAEVQFSRIRWEADFLLVKMRGGDLTRSEGITELEKLNTGLYDLTSKTNSIPNRFLRRAGKVFDRRNPELRHSEEFCEPSEFLRSAAPKTGAGRRK